MATNIMSSTMRNTVVVDTNSDMIIQLTIFGERINNDAESKQPAKEIVDFKVNREKINSIPAIVKKGTGAGTFFKGKDSPHWRHIPKASKIKILIDEEFGTSTALEVIWRIFHRTIDDACYDIELKEFWYIVSLCDYLGIDSLPTHDFFRMWYARQPDTKIYKEWQTLIFPLWYFDHAQGFLEITKLLVYNANSHISEINPTTLQEIRVPRLIMQQLNSARGRLKTIFSRGLWKPCAKLLAASCSCAPQTYYDYSKALVKADVWPIEDKLKIYSMDDITDKAVAFKFENKAQDCSQCSDNYKFAVSRAVSDTSHSFDGLCLSCIHFSTDRRLKFDDEEYERGFTSDTWDTGCAVSHGQPTWWFSYNAKPEDKKRFVKRIHERSK